MTTAICELLPGYRVHEPTGAWLTLPWPAEPDERHRIAAHSLGPNLVRWAQGELDMPGLTDYQTGRRWRFTDGQKRFIALWYYVDADGRFPYRSAVYRRSKGGGKDPLAAALANCELVGPCELYDIDDDGTPIGQCRAMPLVQVISNSEAQSTDVLRIANAMWNAEAREYYRLDCGQTRTVVKDSGGRFEVPPTAEASGEGDPATAIMLNESEHMTESNGGARVSRMARRNVGKTPAHIGARVVELCNAHRPGDNSVAEQSFTAWQKQLSPAFRGARDILYDSIEAPPTAEILTEAGRLAGLAAAYMDAPWSDMERKSAEIADPRTPVSDSIRFYLNGLAMAEDAWVDPTRFDGLAEARTVADGEQIAVFVDCSKSADATALAAVRLSDMYVFAPADVTVWERPQGLPTSKPWRAPRGEVDAVVRSIFERYAVAWLGVDPSPATETGEDIGKDRLYWADTIDGWHRDFGKRLPVWASGGHVTGNAVLFDMRVNTPGAAGRNRAFTEAAELVARWIDEDGLAGPLRHDGNADLRRHVHNARQRATPWGTSLSKVSRDSNRHIDLAVCMVGAVLGARLALNSGKLKRKGAGKGRTVIMR